MVDGGGTTQTRCVAKSPPCCRRSPTLSRRSPPPRRRHHAGVERRRTRRRLLVPDTCVIRELLDRVVDDVAEPGPDERVAGMALREAVGAERIRHDTAEVATTRHRPPGHHLDVVHRVPTLRVEVDRHRPGDGVHVLHVELDVQCTAQTHEPDHPGGPVDARAHRPADRAGDATARADERRHRRGAAVDETGRERQVLPRHLDGHAVAVPATGDDRLARDHLAGEHDLHLAIDQVGVADLELHQLGRPTVGGAIGRREHDRRRRIDGTR